MRRLGTLLVVRVLVVANTIVLLVVGGLSLAYVERPAGVLGAAVCWALAGCLIGLLPLTDPYRVSRRSRH